MQPGQMNVLLGPVEIAGQVALSGAAIRQEGVQATAYTPPHPFGYPIGPDLSPPARIAPTGQFRPQWWSPLRTSRLLITHNIIHYHFGTSYLGESRRHLDARLCRRLHKKVIVQFHGSEVRRPSIETARNPYYLGWPGESDERALRCLSLWSRITGGHCVLSDVGLDLHVADHFPHVHHVPLCVNLRQFPLIAPIRNLARPPVVVHAPTDVVGKGTDVVRATMRRLAEGGRTFIYNELRGRSRREVASATAEADIVIDQLRTGTFGVFALEAMTLAKPVISYIQPALVDALPSGLPIVNANPDTLEGVLTGLLDDRTLQLDIGAASRSYVEREHDISKLGPRLIEIYASL